MSVSVDTDSDSEDEPGPPEVPNMSVDEYRRFCIDKNIPFECELCKMSNWEADIPENYSHVITVKQTGRATYFISNRNLFMTVNRLFCETCGNVRTHTSRVIERWRRLNPDR